MTAVDIEYDPCETQQEIEAMFPISCLKELSATACNVKDEFVLYMFLLSLMWKGRQPQSSNLNDSTAFSFQHLELIAGGRCDGNETFLVEKVALPLLKVIKVRFPF